jgi:hypothetical protein
MVVPFMPVRPGREPYLPFQRFPLKPPVNPRRGTLPVSSRHSKIEFCSIDGIRIMVYDNHIQFGNFENLFFKLWTSHAVF